MRELKFRIWDKTDREWTSYPPFFSSAHGKIFEFFPSKYQAENLVIQQFTGLTDKNGKEIYEGDIVRFDEPTKLCQDVYMSSLYVFGFYNGSFLNPVIYNSINGRKFSKVEPNSLNPDGRAKLDSNPHFDWTRAEVLGNIYEDSELIDL